MHSSPSSFNFDPKQPLFAFPKPLSQLLLRSSLQSPLLLDPLQGEDCIRTTDEPSSDVPFWIPGRVFGDDPSWFSSIFRLDGTVSLDPVDELGLIESEIREYNELRKRQLKVETESWENAVEEYKKLLKEMCHNKLAPNLPFFKSLIVGWFEPFRDAIASEQKLQEQKKHKTAYGPYIGLLPADKMAVIVMHKILGLLMSGHYNGCIRVVLAATYIGDAIEQEARIHSFLEKTKKPKRKKVDDDQIADQSKEQDMLRKRVENLMKKQKCKELQKVLKVEGGMESWGQNARVKLGSRLIHLLIETACMLHQSDQLCDGPPEIRPAFKHSIKTIIKEPGRGCARKCGVIECDLQILQGLDKAARHSVIPYMPMLIPPRSWKCYNDGGYLFIPSYVIRTHGSKKQQEAIRHAPCKQLSTVFEALDTLGRTKWRVNRRVLDVLDSLWAKGECVAGLVDHENIPIPEKPDSEDASELQKWSRSVRKAQKINAERFSQRCDIELKLSVARKMMKEEGFYYPHNLDFRGRAYPMHPHLSHLNSDLCRGVLEFAEGRSLGKSGLHWLKIHLANLYAGGIEKLSFDGRLSFVENHLRDIFDSAERPIDGERWWLTAEDPLQCLAACMNLSDALKSPSPHHVISHLPVHQDGSCNGLQHYAALGRDSLEAAAVNLVANEKPADVYSGIAARVHDIIKRDSMKDPATDPTALLARILLDQVDRKLVKQTVMTSVYGVTYVGAREQIKRRLVEKGHITDDNVLFHASCYAAKVTLTAIGEKFQAARDIMKWLGDCAKVITSQNQPVRWTTPLGLPVVQPYRKSERHAVRTSLQVLSLQREGSLVDVKRQRTAFPPNFVHSLDGSHMMMTAIACGKAGLHFAGVHDSYWTHACDVDKMNVILRAKFVELYSKPVLENLFESFQTSFPTLHFPTMPNRGNFDMHEVLGSPYFFN